MSEATTARKPELVIDNASIQVRGYEVAKRGLFGGWEQVAKYRATERGKLEAIQSAEFLQERHLDRATLRAKDLHNKLVMAHFRALATGAPLPEDPPTLEKMTLDAQNAAAGFYAARTVISFAVKEKDTPLILEGDDLVLGEQPGAE